MRKGFKGIFATITAIIIVFTLISPTSAQEAALKLNKIGVTLGVGETFEAKVRTESKEIVAWKSTDSTIADITAEGVITAKKVGTATISASIGDSVGEMVVTVKKTPDELIWTVVAESNKKGEEDIFYQVTSGKSSGRGTILLNNIQSLQIWTILPMDTASNSITYKSSDLSVAVIDDTGLLQAVGNGECRISISVSGKRLVSIDVNVDLSGDSNIDFDNIFSEKILTSKNWVLYKDTSTDSIYRIQTGKTVGEQITHEKMRNETFSSNNKWIRYEAGDKNNYGLYIVNINGTRRMTIADGVSSHIFVGNEVFYTKNNNLYNSEASANGTPKNKTLSNDVGGRSISEVRNGWILFSQYENSYLVIRTDGTKSQKVANAAVASAIINDITPPVIKGAQNLSVEVDGVLNYRYNTVDISVTDDSDPSPQLSIDSSLVDIRKEGVYPVTYTATDRSGNTSTIKIYVTVTKLTDTRQSIIQMADSRLKTLGVFDMSDPILKVQTIQDYVLKNIIYMPNSTQPNNDTLLTYNALKTMSGDCITSQLVSDALLTRAGIETIRIRNIKDSHYWLLIKMDGLWYHYDSQRFRDGDNNNYMFTNRKARELSILREPLDGFCYVFDPIIYPQIQ